LASIAYSGPEGDRYRDLILGLVGSHLLDCGSKLTAASPLSPDTTSSSLREHLGLSMVDGGGAAKSQTTFHAQYRS